MNIGKFKDFYSQLIFSIGVGFIYPAILSLLLGLSSYIDLFNSLIIDGKLYDPRVARHLEILMNHQFPMGLNFSEWSKLLDFTAFLSCVLIASLLTYTLNCKMNMRNWYLSLIYSLAVVLVVTFYYLPIVTVWILALHQISTMIIILIVPFLVSVISRWIFLTNAGMRD